MIARAEYDKQVVVVRFAVLVGLLAGGAAHKTCMAGNCKQTCTCKALLQG